jgi:hypothetical protein
VWISIHLICACWRKVSTHALSSFSWRFEIYNKTKQSPQRFNTENFNGHVFQFEWCCTLATPTDAAATYLSIWHQSLWHQYDSCWVSSKFNLKQTNAIYATSSHCYSVRSTTWPINLHWPVGEWNWFSLLFFIYVSKVRIIVF